MNSIIITPGFKKNVSHRIHANLINRHVSCHPTTQSSGEIPKIHINRLDPPTTSRKIQGIQRSQPTLLFWLPSYMLQQVKEQKGASVVVKNWPLARCWHMFKQPSFSLEVLTTINCLRHIGPSREHPQFNHFRLNLSQPPKLRHLEPSRSKPVTPRFPKYARAETRRKSAMYIREKNTPRIHAMPKVPW